MLGLVLYAVVSGGAISLYLGFVVAFASPVSRLAFSVRCAFSVSRPASPVQ